MYLNGDVFLNGYFSKSLFMPLDKSTKPFCHGFNKLKYGVMHMTVAFMFYHINPRNRHSCFIDPDSVYILKYHQF